MKITAKQANVLQNLHRIVIRKIGGGREPFLDGASCKQQVNSLGAKGLIVLDARGRPTKAETCVERPVIGYKRNGVSRARARPKTFASADTKEDRPPGP